MELTVKLEFHSMSVGDLLGHPLNDVESKYAPETVFCKGPMKIPLPSPRVSIIGSRRASEGGLLKAKEITRLLTENGAVIVGGLARGIDTAGHKAAIECGGKTIAVIGTPLNKAYPKENSELQEELMRNHLVISQYSVDHPTTPKDFVLRNRTMALISDASVIVEAGDASGSLHHGWEALRIGRPLFVRKAMVEDEQLQWPKKMMQYGAIELDEPEDILESLPSDINVSGLFQ